MAHRIALLIPGLTGGGAERVMLTLAAHSLAQGRRVDLVMLKKEGELLPLVPNGIRMVDLARPRVRYAVRAIRRYVKEAKPDILLVSLWPMTAAVIIACLGLTDRPKIILCDHNDLSAQYGRGILSRLQLWLSIRFTYHRADALVGVSRGVAGSMARLAGLTTAQVTTIYNPVPALPQAGTDDTQGRAFWGDAPGPRFLTVGKFKSQKNHALLLDAFAKVLRDKGGMLAIVVNGPKMEATRAYAATLGLTEAVRFPGFTLDPAPWYASADVFVLSSDHEGLGNVLIEALQFGLPVVSTDCPSGPAEILGDMMWGQLVPVGDAERLADAMATVLTRPVDREALKTRAAMFAPEVALKAYEDLFARVASGEPKTSPYLAEKTWSPSGID